MSKIKTKRQSLLKECSFCKREDYPEGFPPVEGEKAIGSYRDHDDYGRVIPFRGYICDMHKDEISWKKFRWGWEKR